MKVLRFAVPVSIPVVLLAATQIMAACGSSTTTPGNGTSNPDAAAPGNGDDSSTGNPQQADTGSGGGSDSGTGGGNDANPTPITDSGITLPPAEAGSLGTVLPGQPGHVQCGTSTCDLTSSTCCASADGGEGCAQGATATCPQAAIHCAQAADCASGSVCCASLNIASLSAQSSCKAVAGGACPAPGAQMCSTDAECASGVKCTKQNCQGEILELCGLFSLLTIQCTAL